MVLVLLLSACGVHTRAPDFSLTTFSAEEFRLSDLNDGESLVINFWYPSCPPCRDEMPHFQTVWEGLSGQDIRFLGLFVPKGFDTE
ncbi:TlpA family protein disulfide reductase, partial [Dehalococcoidia bacterium]|nr:TlpA family protein disulfide reductase [Dehalococcoidia bacterium]